jgi:hypothetical protein
VGRDRLARSCSRSRRRSLGWLLISTSLPRLPAVTTSILLTFQPVCSGIFAALIVDESPSWLQLAGAGCILLGARRRDESGGARPRRRA